MVGGRGETEDLTSLRDDLASESEGRKERERVSFGAPQAPCMWRGWDRGRKARTATRRSRERGALRAKPGVRTTGRLAVIGTVVAVPPPGATRGAAVVHLQRVRTFPPGVRTVGPLAAGAPLPAAPPPVVPATYSGTIYVCDERQETARFGVCGMQDQSESGHLVAQICILEIRISWRKIMPSSRQCCIFTSQWDRSCLSKAPGLSDRAQCTGTHTRKGPLPTARASSLR